MTVPPRSRVLLQSVAFGWLGLLVGFAVGVEWIRSRSEPPLPSGGIDLTGAGATLPFPLYRRWFQEYGRQSGVAINYYSVGSAEGIRMVLAGDTDFGAADRPLTAAERTRASCGAVEIPTVLGAVVVAYRVPGHSAPLRLDAETLADIFLGRVTRWDDAPIQALNPGLRLPALEIRPVRRARVTGTGAVFNRYLAASLRWRAAEAAGGPQTGSEAVEGNEGITAAIAARDGAIGAVELTYAQQARLAVANLRNAAGEYVAPSSSSVAAAARSISDPSTTDTLPGLVNSGGADAYPVVALTRIIVDGVLRDAATTAHFVSFAQWALRDGANLATELGYAPLPESVRARELRYLATLTPGACPAPARR